MSEAVVLNDGIGVNFASRLLYGEPFPENLNGTDFCPSLLDAAGPDARVFLLGGTPSIAEKAGAALRERGRGVSVVGTHHGYFELADSQAIVQMAIDSGANIMLVGMGQPKQEIWAAQYAAHFPGPVLCVGACLDFMAGKFSRAPHLFRALNLEWAYRLTLEPKRLARRYLIGNFSFIFAILGEKIDRRRTT
jgi:alpha-1,3-mannosyltransferase